MDTALLVAGVIGSAIVGTLPVLIVFLVDKLEQNPYT